MTSASSGDFDGLSSSSGFNTAADKKLSSAADSVASFHTSSTTDEHTISSARAPHTFCKTFHLPSACNWSSNPHWIGLASHTYETKNHAEALACVSDSLTQLGYQGASMKMKHDYLAHLLSDVLKKNGVPHLTKEDFTRSDKFTEVQKLFNFHRMVQFVILRRDNQDFSHLTCWSKLLINCSSSIYTLVTFWNLKTNMAAIYYSLRLSY